MGPARSVTSLSSTSALTIFTNDLTTHNSVFAVHQELNLLSQVHANSFRFSSSLNANERCSCQARNLATRELRACMQSHTVQRLCELTTLEDPDNQRYALGRLPVDLEWKTLYDDNSRYVCEGGHPVRLWILAEVRQIAFVQGNRNARNAALCFQPLLPSDRIRAARLQSQMSIPLTRKFFE